MKRQRCLLLAVVIAVTAAALWAGWHGLRSRPKPAVLAQFELTPEVRARIDRIAAASPLETVEQEQINFAGDITAWLIGHALPSAEEEANHASRVRQQFLSRHKPISTPAFSDTILRRLTDPLPLLRERLTERVASPCLRRCARQLLSDLILPEEVLTATWR